MGGNNPLIVWDPADVESAADIAAQSAFLTTGQRCSCARRIILPNGEWGDQVVEAIVERAKKLQIGDATEEGAFMGPLVSEQAAQNATDFQMMLSKKGGKSLRRLKRMDRGGGFVTAGVIDITDANDVPDEELFGPLMQIIRVDSFDDAITRGNESRHPEPQPSYRGCQWRHAFWRARPVGEFPSRCLLCRRLLRLAASQPGVR